MILMMLNGDPDLRQRELAHAAESYARSVFGTHLRMEPIKPTDLPHFLLDRYALWRGEIMGNATIFVLPQSGTIEALDHFLRHRELMRREIAAPLFILVLETVSAALRRRLVERRIAFITPGTQFYVPEAFLDLRETLSSEPAATPEQISPTAQVLIIAALMRQEVDDMSLTHLAERYQVAVMSMSRALDELEMLELAQPCRVGRQRRLRLRTTGRELWDKAEERLQSPVRKTRLISGNLPPKQALLAGESALARKTMLAEPRIQCHAVPAAEWRRIARNFGLVTAWPFDESRIELQTWAYDPQVLTNEDIVDPLSLYLSTRHDEDERIAQAARQVLETFTW